MLKLSVLASTETNYGKDEFLLVVDEDSITGPTQIRLYDMERLSTKEYLELQNRPNLKMVIIESEQMVRILADSYFNSED